jgi:hypothetical protein
VCRGQDGKYHRNAEDASDKNEEHSRNHYSNQSLPCCLLTLSSARCIWVTAGPPG